MKGTILTTEYKRAASDGRWRAARSRVRTRVRYGEPCGLCGEPVDLELKRPDPMAFEADHIVPVSKGGHRTRQNNLQPAHAICNGQKGDGEQRAGGKAKLSAFARAAIESPFTADKERTRRLFERGNPPADGAVYTWSEDTGSYRVTSREW